MEDGFSKVASLADLPAGEMSAVLAPDGVQVAIANINGEVFCFENACSHEDASLNFGWLLSDLCQVECPLHEARFDLRTGAAVQPPADYPIRLYEVRMDGEDILVGPHKG